MSQTYYLTTPIYYINDVPHLGSAYTTVAADVLTRYRRLRGRDAFFLTGTDEHGLKIQRAAEERKISTTALADEVSQVFRETWPKLGCAPDDFIRTSSERHKRGAQEIWRRIAAHGDIYLGHYEGLYCVSCEGYYTEKELTQPGNLCPIHLRATERVKEESYFFRLSKYAERLLRFYQDNPKFVEPEGRMNEVKSFVSSGLQDLSISRTTFAWGVPVPGDERHVMWVWIDALSNYWTAMQDPAEHKKYWPADVHLVGKDILRFHAIFWPAFLMAAGFSDAELPRKVFAHGFLTYGGAKMSKTLRNTVSPVALAQAVSATVGVDVVRYCLMRSIAFGQDGDFSIDDVLARYGADLGNTLGNLLNRVFPFAAAVPGAASAGELEKDLADEFATISAEANQAFEDSDPTAALRAIWLLLQHANEYVDKAAPWKAKKEGDAARVDAIMSALLGLLDGVSLMIAPVMPTVSDMMRDQLGLPRLAPRVGEDRWPFAPPAQQPGRKLARGEPIFPRHDPERAAAIRKEFAPPAEPGAQTAEKPAVNEVHAAEKKADVAYDDFAKLDLRVGVIVKAERIPRKDRLLALQVDVGEGAPRSIIAGIAAAYAPEALAGTRVAVLCNLAPKSFGKGLVSHGMVLAASAGDTLKLVTVPGELGPGALIK